MEIEESDSRAHIFRRQRRISRHFCAFHTRESWRDELNELPPTVYEEAWQGKVVYFNAKALPPHQRELFCTSLKMHHGDVYVVANVYRIGRGALLFEVLSWDDFARTLHNDQHHQYIPSRRHLQRSLFTGGTYSWKEFLAQQEEARCS